MSVAAFTGVDRGDRAVGVRDRVLVVPSVICSHVVADRIADRVEGAHSTPHDHGCGQLGADAEQTHRTLVGVGRNPNVAGVVVVGLGCEEVQSDAVAADLAAADVPVREVAIQDAGGTDECIEAGVAAAEELKRAADDRRADLGDLTLGIVSGDADETTREVADPLAGDLARSVAAAGGRVVVAGVERALADPGAAADAAADEATAADLRELAAEREGRPARVGRVRRAATEHGFDALTRAWGDLPVREVVAYGDRATHDAGLALVDAPSEFGEAATGLAAAGAQVVVHVTGEGVPTGHPVVPVLKVSGDAETVAALPEDVDVDATAATASDLEERVRAVADGERSCAERHGLDEFAMTRVGPST